MQLIVAGKLIKQSETHVIVFFFLLLNRSSSSSSSWSITGSWSSSSCKLAGISQELLELLSLLEGDLSDGSNGQEVLHTIGNAVRSTGHGWVANGQAHSCNIGHTCTESLLDVIISNVQDLWAEH